MQVARSVCPPDCPDQCSLYVRLEEGRAVTAVLALPAAAGKFGVRGGGYTMSAQRNGAVATALVPDEISEISGGACFNDARVEVGPVSG